MIFIKLKCRQNTHKIYKLSLHRRNFKSLILQFPFPSKDFRYKIFNNKQVDFVTIMIKKKIFIVSVYNARCKLCFRSYLV